MTRRKATPQQKKNTPPEVKKALAFIGFFTRVAEKVGVDPSHAVAVAKERRTSRRVMQAIVSEVRRIEREAERAA